MKAKTHILNIFFHFYTSKITMQHNCQKATMLKSRFLNVFRIEIQQPMLKHTKKVTEWNRSTLPPYY